LSYWRIELFRFPEKATAACAALPFFQLSGSKLPRFT